MLRGMNQMLHERNVSTVRLSHLVGNRVAAHGTPKTWIARSAGVHQQAFYELLAGKRRLTRHYATKLAPVLGVTPEYLMGDED